MYSWVDDFSVFCRTEYEAQSTLFGLGEWLFSNHGLTLQAAKTRIVPIAEYRSEHLVEPEEQLTGRDAVLAMFRDLRFQYDLEDDEIEDSEVEDALSVLQSNNLRGMLSASLADTQLVDYPIVAYALQKLPRIPGASADLRREVLNLVIDNAQLLYPVAESIAGYVLSFNDLSWREQKNIAAKLLKPLRNKRHQPPPVLMHYGSCTFLRRRANGITPKTS